MEMTQGEPMNQEDFLALFSPRLYGKLVTESQDVNEALTAVQRIREAFADDALYRAWMFGMNPHLNDANPLLEIIAGNSGRVMVAVRAYLDGSASA
jgi:hypothetical protein